MPSDKVAGLAVEFELLNKKFYDELNKTTKAVEKHAADSKRAITAAYRTAFNFAARAGRKMLQGFNKELEGMVQLLKRSENLFIDISQLQKLDLAARAAGIDVETLDLSLRQMVKSIGEAQEGSSATAGAFARLGLNIDKLARLNTAEQLLKITEATERLGSATERQAIRYKIFRETGFRIHGLQANQMKELFTWVNKTGLALDATAKKNVAAYRLLSAKFDFLLRGLKLNVANSLLPVVSEFIKNLVDGIDEMGGFKVLAQEIALIFIKAFNTSITIVQVLLKAVQSIWKVLNKMSSVVESIKSLSPGNLAKNFADKVHDGIKGTASFLAKKIFGKGVSGQIAQGVLNSAASSPSVSKVESASKRGIKSLEDQGDSLERLKQANYKYAAQLIDNIKFLKQRDKFAKEFAKSLNVAKDKIMSIPDIMKSGIQLLGDKSKEAAHKLSSLDKALGHAQSGMIRSISKIEHALSKPGSALSKLLGVDEKGRQFEQLKTKGFNNQAREIYQMIKKEYARRDSGKTSLYSDSFLKSTITSLRSLSEVDLFLRNQKRGGTRGVKFTDTNQQEIVSDLLNKFKELNETKFENKYKIDLNISAGKGLVVEMIKNMSEADREALNVFIKRAETALARSTAQSGG